MLDDLYLLSRRYLANKYKPYHREIFLQKSFKHRLSILVGQRGIGKTTLLVQHLLAKANHVSKAGHSHATISSEILYIPADHFLMGTHTLYEIAEQFVQAGGKYIAFDEIHQYRNWSGELKSIYDTFPNLTILASGSSALEIYKGSHDLTRRAIVYRVNGFSFREYLELTLDLSLSAYTLPEILANHENIAPSIIKQIEKKQHKILPLFHRYLQVGYYPYFLELENNNDTYAITLEQNFHTVIESDLAAIYPALTGHSLKKIKQLLSFIASAVPFTPNWQKIKTIVDIGDERTLKLYFKYLEDAGLIRTVMKYSQKMKKIEMPEKVYLDNTNQLYAITPTLPAIGTVRETFFLTMLSPMHEVAIPSAVDFIIDQKFSFEIGGKNKSFDQIKSEKEAYLAVDQLETGIKNRLPLWLFGFLY